MIKQKPTGFSNCNFSWGSPGWSENSIPAVLTWMSMLLITINGLRETITAESQEWKRDGGGGWELGNWCFPILNLGLPVAQTVKNLPAMLETQVQSLGREDPLEKGMMATQSNILAWRISWTEEPGRLQSMGSQSRIRLSDWAWQRHPPPQLLCSPNHRYTYLDLHEVFVQCLSTDLKNRMRISKQFTIPTHTSTLVCTHIPWGGEGHSTPILKKSFIFHLPYRSTLISLSLWMQTGHITAPAVSFASQAPLKSSSLCCVETVFLEIWPNLRSHELYVNTGCSKGKGTLNSFIQ